ncbi:hypothetical protein EI613_13300 [Azospirillum sp. 412522]|nr:hypothetical protein [Azospirillum sp. 412522]MBY6262875.1 hypothetical protein [Azospirillum sp. 412522]
MSEYCNVVIKNNSGRSIDAAAVWHSAGIFGIGSVNSSDAAAKGSGIGPGGQVSGSALLSESPVDYWVGGILFHGDGTKYIICAGFDGAPKEYEVSEGSTITFIINGYTSSTTNQPDVTIQYSGDNGGSASLYNSQVVAAAQYVEGIVDFLVELAAD